MPTTRAEVSAAFRRNLSRTWFTKKTNETSYPARWSYGRNAGDATTSDPYDCRHAVAARATIRQFFPGYEGYLDGLRTQRDAIKVILAALQRATTAAE